MVPINSLSHKIRILVFLLSLVVHSACQSNESDENTAQDLRVPSRNSIVNLYDAFGEENDGLKKDFGFSCIINYNGKIILFDGGTNADIFKNNVINLKMDLSKVDIVVASHSHFDHINGFDYLLQVNPDVKIYFPNDLFWGANIPFDLTGADSTITDSLDQRMKYFDGNYKNYKFNQTGRFWNANVQFVKESMAIDSGITLITTRSPNMGYFNKYPSLEQCENCESVHAKFNGLKEISLALRTENGDVLFVGCSHSTVERIIDESKTFTKNSIAMLYGGYHLLPYDRTTLEALAKRLKYDHKVKKVAPAHCTGHLAFKILKDEYEEDYVFAGLGETVSF